MRINGEWYLCDDDIVRPVIRGEVMNVSGFWRDDVICLLGQRHRYIIAES